MKRQFSVDKPANAEEDLSSGASTSRADISGSSEINQTNNEPPQKRSSNDPAAVVEQITTEAMPLAGPLTHFLNCVICQDTSIGAIYHCRNGHIICESCHVRLVAESRMRKQPTRCPLCRIFISRSIRCLTAERMAALLPIECIHCGLSVPRLQMKEHELRLCPKKPSLCKYWRIGCTWSGPYEQQQQHELNCEQAKKPLATFLPEIKAQEVNATAKANANYGNLIKSFGSCRFFFHDLHTVDFVYNNVTHAVHFFTPEFRAYDYNWSIKLKFIHPEYVNERWYDVETFAASYQLILHTRTDRLIKTRYFITHNGDTGVNFPLRLHNQEFSPFNGKSVFKVLQLASPSDTYRILSKSKFRFRFFLLIMP